MLGVARIDSSPQGPTAVKGQTASIKAPHEASGTKNSGASARARANHLTVAQTLSGDMQVHRHSKNEVTVTSVDKPARTAIKRTHGATQRGRKSTNVLGHLKPAGSQRPGEQAKRHKGGTRVRQCKRPPRESHNTLKASHGEHDS